MIYNLDNYNNDVEPQTCSKPCYVCNNLTYFTDFYTKLYICSDECLDVLKQQTDSIEEGHNHWRQ